MKNILLDRKIIASFLNILVISVITSTAVYAEQVGVPETSIIVSQQNSAADTEDCGTNLTPTCRTIQHAVNRIAPDGIITVFPGTFFENILVDKEGITIDSLDGWQDTVIDGSAATNETVSEAIRIIADGVTIGLHDSSENGFTLQNSTASGLFSIGSWVEISGNVARNNGARGFQFGLSTVDDSIDNSSKNILDDPLNGATIVEDNAALQTQSNIRVSRNAAILNDLGGFYFSAFDDSFVHTNIANDNRGNRGLGQGSGFWIDIGSNRLTLEGNSAFSNSGDGIFYRRGFGADPAGLVTDQTAIGNTVGANGRHGIVFMGNNIIAQDNISESNQGDGFHFMGYDTVLDISNNALRGNSGAGIALENGFFNNNMNTPVGDPFVSPLNLGSDGNPIQQGGIHHNVISGNQSHNVPGLAGAFVNCGIATNLNNGTTIEIGANDFSTDQEICDEFNIISQR